MKNKRAGLLSAKLTRKSNCPFIQKESFELSPSIINKTKKYNNLSLTINNNNKEKSYGLLSQNTKNFSTKFARSLSNNNILLLPKKIYQIFLQKIFFLKEIIQKSFQIILGLIPKKE